MGSRFEIVKSTDGFIFGGYASAVKDGVGDFTVDQTAFVFDLDRPNTGHRYNARKSSYSAIIDNQVASGGPNWSHDFVIDDEEGNGHTSYYFYNAKNGQQALEQNTGLNGGDDKYFKVDIFEILEVS